MTLVQDYKGRSHISPSLDNLKFNEPVLRPFTRAMAEAGRIHKPLRMIKAAVEKFYSREIDEIDEMVDTPETTEMQLRRERNINKSAKAILSMLSVIKRKWTKWEIPRETWT